MLKHLAEVIGYTVGLGMLLLPFLFQKTGVVIGVAVISFISLLLIPLAFIFADLLRISRDIDSAISSLTLPWVPYVAKTLFTYGALTAYIIAAGDQLFAWLGGDPRYWSTIFFVFAIIPLFFPSLSTDIQFYLTTALFALLFFLIPENALHTSIAVPPILSLRYLPLLASVSLFALFGHYSIGRLRREMDEVKSLQVFFAGFFLVYIFYVLYPLTASYTLPKMGVISTASLLQIYPPQVDFILSFAAILAFYTSFYSIGRDWLEDCLKITKRNAAYALLFIPVAFLYLLVRRFHLLTVLDLVARIASSGIFLVVISAAVAHYRASKRIKTSIPGKISLLLAFIFAILSISCFLPL